MMTFNEIQKELTDTEALVLTVYGEARGEPVEGQIAVMNVIKNRAARRKQTIKEVCFAPKQFSCWNSNDPNYPILIEMATEFIRDKIPGSPMLRQITFLAGGVIGDILPDNTKGADHYMTNWLFNSEKRPTWAKEPKNLNRIGQHVFMNV